MKKQFLLLTATVFTVLASFGQQSQIPNGSFENWVDSTNPVGWATYASLAGDPSGAFLAKKITAQGGYTDGVASLELETATNQDSSGNPISAFPGFVRSGDDGNGFAFASQPDSLTFDYLYVPANANDSAVVGALFYKQGQAINGTNTYMFASTDTQWVHKSLPFGAAWTTGNVPDTLYIDIESSKDTALANAGAFLLVDNIKFVYNTPTGIAAVNKDLNAIKMYPSPASSVVTIDIPTEVSAQNITIVDMLGRAVKTVNNVAGKSTVDVDGLGNGNYLVTFTNAANKSFTGSKFLQVKK